MTWFGIFLIAIWALGPILTITSIGKPREPIDNGYAAFSTVLSAALITLLFVVGTGR
jgi:hypothetical protein